jgi:fibronectin-binding autotransporter adhesin
VKKLLLFIFGVFPCLYSVTIAPTEVALSAAITATSGTETIYFSPTSGTINLVSDLPPSDYYLAIYGPSVTLNNQSLTNAASAMNLYFTTCSTDIINSSAGSVSLTQGEFSGNLTGTGGFNFGTTQSVSVTISGTNSYDGTTIVNVFNADAADGVSTTINSASAFGSGAVDVGYSLAARVNRLNINESNTINDLEVFEGSIITIASGKTVTMNGVSLNQSVSGVITGAGNIVKSGSTNTHFKNAMTYTGTTSVTANTLIMSGSGSISSSSAVSVSSGATLNVQSDTTLQHLTGDGSLSTSSSPTITVSNSSGNDTTFSGNITGTGSLVKTGAGKLTLTGANGFSGSATVSAGTLVVDEDSLPVAITNNSELEFNEGTTVTYSQVIDGSGNFTKTAAGNLTLSGSNLYSGNTAVTAGTLTAGSTQALGVGGSTSVASGATLAVEESITVENLSGAGNATISSGKVLYVGVVGSSTLEW